jgi:cobyric acid synthase CobQ/L-threonine-O-3-phosphate decarboxylase
MNYGHGGDIRRLARRAGRETGDMLDFSVNINPLGPPDWLREVISANISSLTHYPDISCTPLVQSITAKYICGKNEVIAGNGSSEIIHLLPRALNANRVLIPSPAYIDYEAAAKVAGLPVKTIAMPEETGFAPSSEMITAEIKAKDLVFIGHPVNPSGVLCETDDIRNLALNHPDSFFAVDEAFLDFVFNGESLSVTRPENVIVLISFTKIFAIPGLRLGSAIADAALIKKLKNLQPCWSVNTLAMAVGEKALKDNGYVENTQHYVAGLRESLYRELHAIPGLKVYPGMANYLLARIEKGATARELAGRMLEHGIAIRVCDNYRGLDERYFRVAVRTEKENEKLIEALKESLGHKVIRSTSKAARKTSAIMFQGTCSNAGKSILTAAFCRIMLQDGFRVAPFKAQNMSLNSFVTRDGGEMGRAQVTQAQACRLDPDVRMNPILLKPNTDTGSQVIVNGKPAGNMNVSEYIRYKPEAFEFVKEAYNSLASEYDAIVIEGAGSPAEVNLKRHDIVNMNMAMHAEAPVLLVGDIDRGGVFASFVGTFEILAEWERTLTAGFIVNKFRGDESLLDDAYTFMLRRTGIPVLGTLPYIADLGLPEEDSVGFKRGDFDRSQSENGQIEIALIDLPHISNFTDFDALRMEPDVHLKTVRSINDLNTPDAVILPGSKNVIGDMKYIEKSGLGRRILELADNGTEIVGICAGFQIMGREISDPFRIESSNGDTVNGLGLLPVKNVIEKNKILKRLIAKHIPSGLPVRGYEIHHGVMSASNQETAVAGEDGAVIGVSSGNAWGTYLHGIFDTDVFRRWFINRLREKRGLSPLDKTCIVYDLEPALNRLSDITREHLNVDQIYHIMGIK